MIFDEQLTPVDLELRRKRMRRRVSLILLLLTAGAWLYWRIFVPVPIDYASEEDHFKYGSIGADTPYGGIPFQVWQVLPEMFPEHLPEKGAGYLRVPPEKRSYLDAYATFGFIVEPGHSTPVGFSRRRVGVDLIGFNCALCHTGTIRVADGMDVQSIYLNREKSGLTGQRGPVVIDRLDPLTNQNVASVVIPGMPGITVDLEAYFAFLFRCAKDERFTVDAILMAVEDRAASTGESLSILEKLALKTAIPRLRNTLLTRREQLHYVSLLPHVAGEPSMPRFGPGRVDTFSPYKSIQFGFPWDGMSGIADYPSLWNQRPREGWDLHWDGNNSSVFERNLSASLGAGTSPTTIDMRRLFRVARYTGSPPPPNPDFGGSTEPTSPAVLDSYRDDPFPREGEMQIPRYPFSVDLKKAEHGKTLFAEYCYQCHGWKGSKTGTVEDIKYIGTDTARLDSYTEEVQSNQNLLGVGQWWRLKTFKKTNGYSNAPLDGVWTRAPYLHNGSVPTLTDLFNAPCELSPIDEKIPSLEALLNDVVTPQDVTKSVEEKFSIILNSQAAIKKLIEVSRSKKVRPPIFYRGDDRYDPVNVGFRCDKPNSDDGRALFLYTSFEVRDGHIEELQGNTNVGHYDEVFGTALTPEETDAIVEYQKLIGQPEWEVKP